MNILFKYLRLLAFSWVILFSYTLNAAQNILIKNSISITGTIANKPCSLVISSKSGINSAIDFGVYNKASKRGVSPKRFSIFVFEDGKNTPGCDALSSSSSGFVRLKFGNSDGAQLDDKGVITRGAGDNIRIDIRSIDKSDVNSTNSITSGHHTLTYGSAFAKLGVFNFEAKPTGLIEAQAGYYSGVLSVSVEYE